MAKTKGYIQLDLFGKAPEVIIDTHEVNTGKKTSITLFLERIKTNKISYTVKKLDIGDIIFPNNFAIERKTVRDFLNSLMGSKNGRARLFEQIRLLSQSYEHPFLLIEGGLSVRLDVWDKAIYIPIRKKRLRKRIYAVIEERIGVHPNAFLGTIKKIEDMGITVLKSYDPLHGCQILWSLFLKARGKEALNEEISIDKYPVIRVKPRLKGIREQQIFFLCGLPGISYARAIRILETYKTPYNAIMKVRRWDIDVTGIGPGILDKVHKVLFQESIKKDEEK